MALRPVPSDACSDKTYISAIIGVLYIAATAHCFVRTAVISRETDSAQRVFALVSRGAPALRVVGGDVITADGTRLPPGQVTGHIRNLILKAGAAGQATAHQTLLLRGLAGRAARSQPARHVRERCADEARSARVPSSGSS